MYLIFLLFIFHSMSASFFTFSSFNGNDKFSCLSCSFKTLKNLFPHESSFRPLPTPLASVITFFTSSGCKLCFLVPGITHSQETKNHNKQQFHLLVFSDDSLISKETEKQNEVCNMGVAWPFWQVRKRVHMILKTSYKITFLLSFNAKLVVYRLVYDRTWKKKAFTTFFFELVQECFPQHKKTRFFVCINLEFKSIGWKNCGSWMFV